MAGSVAERRALANERVSRDILETGSAPLVQNFERETDGPSVGDTAGAYFMQETVLGGVADYIRQGVESGYEGPSEQHDGIFSPFRFYADNQDEFEPHVEEFLLDGHFDNVQNPDEFQAKVSQIDRELDRRKVIRNSSFAGHVAGMATSFLDVSSLVPLTAPFKAGKLGATALTTAAEAGGFVAGQEALLHGIQETRTIGESFLNVGVGTALGGGIGAFMHTLGKGKIARETSQAVDINAPVATRSRVPGEDLSAASVSDEIRFKELADFDMPDKQGILSRGLDEMSDKVGFWRTPVSAASNAQVTESRRLIMEMLDTGIVTKGNERGRAVESAEDLVHYYESRTAEASQAHEREWRRLNTKKPGTEGVAAIRDEIGRAPVVSRQDFNKMVYKRLRNSEANVPSEFEGSVNNAVKGWQRYYEEFYRKGVEQGVFQPNQKVEEYVPQLWIMGQVRENPDRLERLLIDMLQKEPDDEWLRDFYGLSKREYDALDDVAQKEEIQKAWNEEQDVFDLEKAEAAVGEAAEEARQRHADLIQASKEARKARTTETNARIEKAEQETRAREVARQAVETERELLRRERDAITRAAEASRRQTLERQQQFIPRAVKDVGEEEIKRWDRAVSKARRAQDDLAKFYAEPTVTIGRKQGSSKQVREFQDFDFIREMMVNQKAKRAELERLRRSDEAFFKPLTAKKTPDPEKTNARASLEGRLKEIEKRLQQLDRQRKINNKRLTTLRYTEDAAKSARNSAKTRRIEANRLRKEAGKKARRAKADAKRARKAADAARRRKNVPDAVKDLVRNGFLKRDEFPTGVLHVGHPSRSKFRALNFTDDQIDVLMDEGYIDFDPTKIATQYKQDMAGRLALREKFGDDALADRMEELRNIYAERAQAARQNGDDKLARSLDREREIMLNEKTGAVVVARDRLLGRYDVQNLDPSEAVMYASRTLRHGNFLRFMGSVVWSSIQDMATISMNVGVGKTLPKMLGKPIHNIAKDMDDQTLAAVLYGIENSPLMNRQSRLYGLDDVIGERGVGVGRTRKVTDAIEHGLQWGTDKMNTLNLMRFWNSRLKFVAGHEIVQNMYAAGKKLQRGENLSAKEMRDMAELTLDERSLKSITSKMDEFGEDELVAGKYGMKLPNAQNWGDDSATRRFYVALRRATDRAVITPGAGDTPPFMSTPMGKLIFQFQTFAFTSVNKWGRKLSYKMANKEWEAATSALWALSMGAASYTIREGLIKDRWDEIKDLPSGGWVRESVDRGGLLFMTNPMLNGGLKLAESWGADFSELGLVPSRYRQSHWLSGMLGPTVSTVDDIQGLFSSLDEPEKVLEKGKRLAPYSNLFYLDAIWRRLNEG
ncbi:hypothetical protein KAJ83_01560 [Marivibrio halodurans]|uniref:Large polyvalent protein associated domain-containing protein n=1 Tax=Marivibrio halodurans TaxID=2039722 RepID=A0A8J7V2E3_9PROT|nr:hypothetical protein [Marivibrio halodurans]MBP5855679.1 hypothetical protein [Marivibrio halodurans]